MTFDFWLNQLGTLKTHKKNAPHKPLLLLTILEIAEQDRDLPTQLHLTPELAFRFQEFEHVVAHRRTQRLDIRLPFHHLGSSKIWTPRTNDDARSPDSTVTKYVEFDPEFRSACLDAEFRIRARRILIRQYFEPAEQLILMELVRLDSSENIELAEGVERSYALEIQKVARDARFRLDVVPTYNYTCALTGYRVTTIDRGTIVDAAHIHQFSTSRNNDVRNGLALCKNAHWAFDAGLWSIDDEYRVVVAHSLFEEAAPNQTPLGAYAGKPVQLPRNKEYWPLQKYLAAHRRQHNF